MKKIYLGICLLVTFVIIAEAQIPLVLYKGPFATTPNATNDRFTLNNLGSFSQIRFQSNVTTSSAWAFHLGSVSSSDYSSNWRPNTSGNTIPANNVFIPTSFANGARYNTGGGGSDCGFNVTNNLYYTFNVGNISASNEVMQILESTFNPTTISTVTQNPLAAAVLSNNSVAVTITTAAAPSSGENVYVRYSTDNFVTSTIAQANFVSNTGTAFIPCFAAGTPVNYYVYSSNKTLPEINADVAGYGQSAHDMATLNLNNNGGSNYFYNVVAAGANFAGIYYISSGSCYTTLAEFITALNAGTVTGPITVYVPAGYTETAPAGGFSITGTGTSTNTIKFQKFGAGANPTFTAFTPQAGGALTDAVFKIVGGDYITIDGFTMQENAGNTTTNNMTEFGVALFYASLTDGAQNNTIQNCTISLNRNYLNTFGIYSNTRHTSSNVSTLAEVTIASGSNSNNKIYSNAISNVNFGIVFIGAGGTTIAAIDNGNDIGGSSLSTGNTITNWGGGGIASGTFISLTTSNYCIFNNQQINDNVSYNTITSAALTNSKTTGGILKNYSVASPTSGNITSTINNNTVSVNNNPSAMISGGIIGINSQGLTLSTATFNMNNNTVQNCLLGGSISTTNGITGITNFSLPGTLNMTGNTLLNLINSASSATSGSITGISNTGAAGTVNINNNIIRGFASTATSGQIVGVNNTGAAVTALNINNNQFGNASGGYFSTSTATSGTLFGISTSGGASTCALSITGNDFRGITYNGTASAAQTYIINTANTLSQNISSNTFTNLNVNTEGSVTFISNNVSAPSTGFKTINGNSIVTAFDKASAGGTVTLYSDDGFSTSTTPHQNNNNNFSNITITGATVMAGWFNNDGTGSTPIKTMTGNTFSNWTCGSGAVNIFQTDFGNPNSLSSNNISNITSQGQITGMLIGLNGTVSALSVTSNTITGLSSTGTGGQVVGISNAKSSTTSGNFNLNVINTLSSNSTTATVAGIATSASATINSNTINSLTTLGTTSGVTNGIMVTGGITVNVYNNKIYDLSTTGAFATTTGVNGIVISGGTTVNTYNNIIGDLRTPAAIGADAIRGISITSTTANSTQNVLFNTINLNSTGGSGFGSSGIFHAAGITNSTANLILRNNIIVNTSTPGTGGVTAAFRRSPASAGLSNYSLSSNNNLLYAGAPSASRLIYYDGTNSDQTICNFIARVTTSDVNDVTEDLSTKWISTTGSSPNFLHLGGATTLAKSGGLAITGYATDYDGDARSIAAGTSTDIGADEFIGTVIVPTITSFTPTTICSNGSTVTITGTNLSGASAVTFNGLAAASFTINCQTQITAVTPVGVTTGVIQIVTPRGTASSSTFTVSGNPTITNAATAAAVCFNSFAQNSTLAYSATTNTPTNYTITWNTAAQTAGLVNVGSTALPATPISIPIAASVPASTYNATITVTNAAGCGNTPSTFTLTINPLPTITTSASGTSICTNTIATTSSLTYSATTNTPTTYSVTWNAAALAAGLVNLSSTAITTSPLSIPIAANVAASTYTGTVFVGNANSCSSVGNSFTVTILQTPTVTTSSNSPVCAGTNLSLIGGANGLASYAWTGPNSYVSPAITQTYTQNFNTLPTVNGTWTDNATIPNWYSQRTGTTSSLTIDNGSLNVGNLYSYGTGGSTERALGTVGSGNATAGSFAHGLSIQNTTGFTITKLDLTYTLEQWRKSGATAAQSIIVSYQISASPITLLTLISTTDPPTVQAGWTLINAATLSSPIFTLTAAALDGNLGANRVTASNVIVSGISIPVNGYIMIKWEDPDHAGNDHGLAIDDVSVTLSTAGTQSPTVSTSATSAMAGNYILTGTAANGCSATATTTVVVNPLPTASIASNNSPQCYNSNAVFNLTGTSGAVVTYNINGAANTTVTLTGGTGTVTITGATANQTLNLVSVTSGSCTITLSASSTVIVNPNLPASVTIAASPSGAICAGTNVTFTATPTNGGNPSTYQWKRGGVNIIGETGSTYTSTTLANGDEITVAMISNASPCLTGSPATSNGIIMTVTAGGTWLGVDNNWFNTANWCGGIPTNSTNVTIPSGLTNYPIITTTGPVSNNISIANGASIIINTAGSLATAGDFANLGTITNNGLIVLYGSSAQTFPGAGTVTAMNNLEIANLSTGVTLNNSLSIGGALIPTSGTLDLGNNNVTLLSTAPRTARVAPLGSTSGFTYGTGRFNIERYLQPIKSWRLLATPVQTFASGDTTSPTINNSWREGVSALTSTGYGTRITGPGTVGTNGVDEYTQRGSMKYYSMTANNYVEITGADMNAGYKIANDEGYYTFVRGDRGVAVTDAATPTTLRMSGKLRTANQTFNVIANAFQSFGNPFASQIDFRTVTKNTVVESFYVWNPFSQGFYNVGAFEVYAKEISAPYDYRRNGSPTGAILNTIESGQAVFIQSVPGGSIVVKESDKAAGTNLFLSREGEQNRVGVSTPTLEIKLNAKNTSGNDYEADAVVMNFDDNFSNTIDIKDVKKINNSTENVGIKLGTSILVVERRSTLTITDTIRLNITGMRVANYKLEIDPSVLSNLPLNAFLVDKFLVTETPLSLSAVTNVPFSITSDAASRVADRFMIVFKQAAAGPLPVSFTTIAAEKNADKTNTVKWNTANEINVSNYDIERSANAVNFTSIGSTAATGNNGNSAAYHFVDAARLAVINYYRVKAISANGQIQYSAIVKVVDKDVKPQFAVQPNPVINKKLNINFENMQGNYSMRLVSKQGATVFTKQLTVSSVSEVKNIEVAGIAAGLYDVLIVDAKGKQLLQTVFIQ